VSGEVKVLSLGGSIVAPEGPDPAFVKAFRALAISWLDAAPGRRLVLVVGGGGPARAYQGAYRQIVDQANDEAQDWIGIMATRLNGELLRRVFEDRCPDPVVTDPTGPLSFSGSILVAAGWKPGFSTDFDSVCLAERFGAGVVVNLSNIAKVYTSDPKLDPSAKPLDSVSWKDFRAMVGDEWTPGKNLPFDPVASRKAESLGLRVICAAGRDLPNLEQILAEAPFFGTIIGA
jgi:uridylate kinase